MVVPFVRTGKTEEGTGLGEENPILLGHMKFEISIRHCIEISITHQLDGKWYMTLELSEVNRVGYLNLG